MSMLNALEATARVKYTQGELTEVTPKYWEFRWKTTGGTATMKLTMLDEEMEYGKAKPQFRTLAPPKFK